MMQTKILAATIVLLMLAAPAWAETTCEEQDVNCWIAELNRTNSPQSMRAAMRLGELQAVKAVPDLIVKFGSKDQYMATAAVHAVVKIGSPAVLELVKATTESKSKAVRKFAAYALGRIGGDDAFAAVQKAAVDEDKRVRAEAARAFGIMKDPRALVPLFDLLRDKSTTVRAAAADSLGAIGDKRAVNHLIKHALTDMSPEVARAGAQALVTIGPPAVEPLIEQFSDTPAFARKRVIVALGNIGRSTDEKSRERAIALATWVLKKKNEGFGIRAVAAYTLGDLGAKEAVPQLKMAGAEGASTEEGKPLATACKTALDKIYQKHELPKDY
jgi:HEAT repeat protein